MAPFNEGPSHFFKYATEAMLRQEWDFAIELIQKAIKLDPDKELYRQTLRAVQERKDWLRRPQ